MPENPRGSLAIISLRPIPSSCSSVCRFWARASLIFSGSKSGFIAFSNCSALKRRGKLSVTCAISSGKFLASSPIPTLAKRPLLLNLSVMRDAALTSLSRSEDVCSKSINNLPCIGRCLMIWRASASTGSLCGIDSRISVSIFRFLDSQKKSAATIRVTIRTMDHLI